MVEVLVQAPVITIVFSPEARRGTPKVRHVMRRVSTLQDSRGSQVLLLVLPKDVAAETAGQFGGLG